MTNVTLMLRDSNSYPNRGAYSAAFNKYFSSFDGVVEPLVDLVVVDGAARFRCVERALPRLKPGGWLLGERAKPANGERVITGQGS